MDEGEMIEEIEFECNHWGAAHETGLTNKVFLANSAMYVQVVSFELDWPSTFFSEKAGAEMELE
ncbi:EGF domain-specific O-linked N-acetylglucosamine transferase-like [Cucumis melo var. makuwa]|uniref:EGF domain-specific O-linked N-acetylglucosamine transferase-like n=1 Tax=Cucumis melo var. makuwa TaxID=1194695 RepID=A0A5D3DKF2_CUCMM|nr:EGF domain-specific O-linked N-acetylglucosamine transferase-like [Cucumis melo var. makuwa]TYK24085.1 EGF domain-specific O-linked N-acetylglucosamine transferase-like [Cucumis melo var. makuwa]